MKEPSAKPRQGPGRWPKRSTLLRKRAWSPPSCSVHGVHSNQETDPARRMAAALASPEGEAVQTDVPNYATGGAVVLDYPMISR